LSVVDFVECIIVYAKVRIFIIISDGYRFFFYFIKYSWCFLGKEANAVGATFPAERTQLVETVGQVGNVEQGGVWLYVDGLSCYVFHNDVVGIEHRSLLWQDNGTSVAFCNERSGIFWPSVE
jgi:hypothetical protein